MWLNNYCTGCKYSPHPLLVESVKGGIEDSLHALQVGEQDHGAGAPTNFDEAALNGVGGAQLAPQGLREIEKRFWAKCAAVTDFCSPDML